MSTPRQQQRNIAITQHMHVQQTVASFGKYKIITEVCKVGDIDNHAHIRIEGPTQTPFSTTVDDRLIDLPCGVWLSALPISRRDVVS